MVTFRLKGHDLDNFDMGGPLIFMAVLGVLHLLVSVYALRSCFSKTGPVWFWRRCRRFWPGQGMEKLALWV